MKVSVKTGAIHQAAADVVVVGVFQDVSVPDEAKSLDAALKGNISDILDSGDFKGKVGDALLIYPQGVIPAKRVVLVGLGEREKYDLDAVRKVAAHAVNRVKKLKVKNWFTLVMGWSCINESDVLLEDWVQAFVEGAKLASYRYPLEKKTKTTPPALTLLLERADDIKLATKAVRYASAVAEGVMLARTLVNHPSNIATPTHLGQIAREIAEKHGIECEVHDRSWAQEQGMGSFLAVAQGAGQPPKFIEMSYTPKRKAQGTIVLVGKGITFDSGGISIKPSKDMYLMKGDMGGGAAVLGVMKAIAMIKPPVKIVALVPATDNMPDANAYKPGDVVTAMNGVSIEVRNTDAEGRMLLADALAYAKQFKPDAVVDLATLTGASVVALGRGMAAALFSNHRELEDALMQSSSLTGERLWPMPLFKEYREKLKSDVADIMHSGGRFGGVGTSATFLKEFVDFDWAHIDIAGMSFSQNKAANVFTPKGATGFGVRLITHFATNWQESKQ